MRLIIDSHLDLAWNALGWKRDLTLPLAAMNQSEAAWQDHVARGRATVSLPEMRRGRVAVALGTLMSRWAPVDDKLPGVIAWLNHRTQGQAYATARGQLAYYEALAAEGEVAILQTSDQLRAHWQSWTAAAPNTDLPVGLIVAMEGCDAIVDPSQAAAWFDAGLRVASLVHYGHSAYAAGTGEEGPLTPRGRAMLKAFEDTGIVLDVTHLCDTSFAEAFDCYGGPLLASHNNCRALVPGQRQFSDEQILQIVRRDGIVGVACDAWMLCPDWKTGQTPRHVVAISALADHVDHICQLAGDCEHVALGSDLDGGFGTEQCPLGLDSIVDLQQLAPILADRGYTDEQIDQVFWGQWLRFFTAHLPSRDEVSTLPCSV
jgi:membrane dipeptidase